jgi:CCR4-NOT transcription complex subunit 9
MLQSQHVFSHQHQYGGEPSWLHHGQQQASHHTSQHPNLAQQHAQAQAAAAAAAAAQQQQHYNRIAVNSNANTAVAASVVSSAEGQTNGESGISEENRKVLGWVAELMDGNRRESALMELSKKREQVPELALIIWHSFGRTFR